MQDAMNALKMPAKLDLPVSLPPAVRQLVIRRMAVIAIPTGSGPGTGLYAAVEAILGNRLTEICTQARLWADRTFAEVRQFPDWSTKSDEEIAQYLLSKVNNE